jgi:murein L,D-transpeptidase YcbB/YkuD
MNVPVLKRIEQLLINIERAKWMPAASEGKLVVVNIPEYELHAWENNKKAFDMEVIVGTEANGTIMFYGNISEVVFSPYWNIPRSITRKEIVPHMKNNKDYLKDNNMQVTGEDNGLPVVRQLPGAKNALGRVKFLFPNSFNIYLHDTPEKSLFSKDKRSDSHGCIRLQDPVKMAQFVLADSVEWPIAKIIEAMNSGKEKEVDVKKTVPVIITYYTAWVDENNILHFADDIYNHDSSMAAKMFVDPQ